jgi:hypothetical protein
LLNPKNRLKMRNVLRMTLACLVVIAVFVSCKKEKKDYRDVWCGAYQLEIRDRQGTSPTTCGLAMTTYPISEVYYDKSMPKDELCLKSHGLVFKLVDNNWIFEGTDDGNGNYEKGHITSDGVLFYEKQLYNPNGPAVYNGWKCHIITIEGQKDESILVY